MTVISKTTVWVKKEYMSFGKVKKSGKRKKKNMNYDTFQTLWEDADCLYCKFYFKIQLDCHYFVRKFIVDVFIACFPGIWIRTVFAFPSHAAFQYAPLMQIRSVAAKWDAVSSFAQIRRLTVFVYDRNLRIFSLVCLLSLLNTVSITSKSHEWFCVTEIWLDGRPPCDDEMDLIVYARPLTLRRLL